MPGASLLDVGALSVRTCPFLLIFARWPITRTKGLGGWFALGRCPARLYSPFLIILLSVDRADAASTPLSRDCLTRYRGESRKPPGYGRVAFPGRRCTVSLLRDVARAFGGRSRLAPISRRGPSKTHRSLSCRRRNRRNGRPTTGGGSAYLLRF